MFSLSPKILFHLYHLNLLIVPQNVVPCHLYHLNLSIIPIARYIVTRTNHCKDHHCTYLVCALRFSHIHLFILLVNAILLNVTFLLRNSYSRPFFSTFCYGIGLQLMLFIVNGSLIGKEKINCLWIFQMRMYFEK